jgi:hypothetical protein
MKQMMTKEAWKSNLIMATWNVGTMLKERKTSFEIDG